MFRGYGGKRKDKTMNPKACAKDRIENLTTEVTKCLCANTIKEVIFDIECLASSPMLEDLKAFMNRMYDQLEALEEAETVAEKVRRETKEFFKGGE